MEMEEFEAERWKGDATVNLLRGAWVDRLVLRSEQYEMLVEGFEFLREWAEMMAEKVREEEEERQLG